MTKEEYAELLKRPEWKEFSRRIIRRDHYTCLICGCKQHLQAHHKYYYRGNYMPWEYEDDAMITLCNKCHENTHLIKDGVVTRQVPIIEKKNITDKPKVDEKEVFSMIDFGKLRNLFTPDNYILFLIFLKICDVVEYNTNRTKMGVSGFKTIRKSVSCKEKKLKESITLLKRLGYLKNNDGFWYVNPHIYWKGDIENKDAACRKYDKMK